MLRDTSQGTTSFTSYIAEHINKENTRVTNMEELKEKAHQFDLPTKIGEEGPKKDTIPINPNPCPKSEPAIADSEPFLPPTIERS